jgi:hypothetical protein
LKYVSGGAAAQNETDFAGVQIVFATTMANFNR